MSKQAFKPVDPKVNFPQLEEEILKYWHEHKTFEKSVDSRPKDKTWTFLDGPPFITGMPHYGTLLSSIPKDVFPRFWTMKGYRVERVWGWDCHGLPAENKVENKLGIERKRDIEEKIGVKKFIDECKLYVSEVSSEWEWYVDHIGRWVDFKNAYRTMDLSYMESVMWVFSEMYKKGYIYKGLRVSLYCPHCATPISNFEVAMDSENHKEITENSTTYKYKIDDKTYILAWSTTPWNKIVTTALAVNPSLTYVKVKQGDEFYILAKTTLKVLKDEPYEVIEEFKGDKLIGVKFEPHYDYYFSRSEQGSSAYKDSIEKGKKVFEIVGAEFVTADEGTGVVTIAAYGEEDLKVMQEQNIHIEIHLDEEGTIKSNVPKFGGMYYLKANKAVDEDLQNRGLIYRQNKYTHTVAHCWRCATKLYYAPQNAWYVNVQTLKEKLKKTNEKVNWFPKHFKKGRFLKSLESAPDWNISRSRYWGSPVPVWECECGDRFVPGSIKELEQASGVKITDLHKPGIDEIVVVCKKCGKNTKRVPEVLDSWIEAGSASFAQRHFPFASAQGEPIKLGDFFPPDFIAEYTGQIRAWFYVLHVIGGALYDSNAFKNVVVEGVILGTDGRKMSKNFGNYPDPKELIQKYGGDALRLYLMGSPVMHGEDIIISEEQYKNQIRGMMLILWNTYNFFVSYANIDKWESSKSVQSSNVLDKWILSLLNKLIKDVTLDLEKYDTVNSISKLQKFVTDFSTWYIRRSRDRVGPAVDQAADKTSFYATTYEVLVTFSKLLAPFAPFLSEEIYRNLTDEQSVHLSNWPASNQELIDDELEVQMSDAASLSSRIHMMRKNADISVKTPLKKLPIEGSVDFKQEIIDVIKAEVNVEELIYKFSPGITEWDMGSGSYWDDASNRNIKAGEARDIIRKIQAERKKLGTDLDEKVDVQLPDWPEEFADEIKRKAMVGELIKANEFKVKRIQS
ncbi:MAG: isoleucine--tRNA ligase [Candidatus Levybacteria bacterium CG10_big_fil_rev_8_21_14_0_10_36_7]|nr:MAG: isoleucine--tRNA ligase [Candidatus Levybacteria bacterium CG10_big_fil_rev_8_21_14_0_10_36_7]